MRVSPHQDQMHLLMCVGIGPRFGPSLAYEQNKLHFNRYYPYAPSHQGLLEWSVYVLVASLILGITYGNAEEYWTV